MKRYFFYSSTGSGIIVLQFPSDATSLGAEQNAKVYQKKLTSGASLSTVSEGDRITETALISAITTAFSGAKVVVEDASSISKTVYLLN